MKAFVLALLATGCINGSKKPGLFAGGAVTAVGVYMATSIDDCNSQRSIGDGVACNLSNTGKEFQAGVVMLAGLGLLLLTTIIPTPDAPVEQAAPVQVAIVREEVPAIDVATNDPMLRELTVQATVAARAGRCLTVQAIADRVGQLDVTFRHRDFVADPLIARCLP